MSSVDVAGRSYREALAYLTSHPDMERGDRLPSELNLERTRFLLETLGRPDRRYRSVLIAGTKGKGSTAAMIERALRAAGYRTGLYTQPHLHTTRERVRLNGEPIAPEDFAESIDRVRAAALHGGPSDGKFTAYELMTTMALERFGAYAVDVAVLEVGLGGRLDSTNVVDAELSVLTSISLDHTRILGDTITAIAREKADIIKPARPCVSAPQHTEATGVIRATAEARGAPLFIAGANGAGWERTPFGGWELRVDGRHLDPIYPALRGGFQRTNSAVAATALSVLQSSAGLQIDAEALRAGLEDVVWAGRFEVAATAPPLILDGAHNVESAQRLREAVHEEYPGLSPIYVLGIAADKDLAGIVAMLCSQRDGPTAPAPPLVLVTAARHPRAARPEVVAALVRSAGVEVIVSEQLAQALEIAASRVRGDNVLVVTGSLHTVAEARVAVGLANPSDEDPFDPWATP